MVRKLSEKPFAVHLPIWRSVIFVDWNGVLCHDVYWSSIANDAQHPLHGRINESRRRLFVEQRSLVDAWQRGEVSSEAIIRTFEIPLDRRCRDDYLLRRLRRDCRNMRTDATLLGEFAALPTDVCVVLATDNVDCFYEQLDAKPELQAVLSGALCSSAVGRLKSQDVIGFFKPWLDMHHLTFADALLLDDSPQNCRSFEAVGGTAIVYTAPEHAMELLRSWLAARPRSDG